MCETFPPNQREACDIPRTSIKVGAENRLRTNDEDIISSQKAIVVSTVDVLCIESVEFKLTAEFNKAYRAF